MTARLQPKLGAYLLVAGSCLLAALAFGRPELAAIGLPFLLALLAGLSIARPPRVELRAALSRQRVLEGEAAILELDVASTSAGGGTEVAALLPAELTGGIAPGRTLRLRAGEERKVQLTLRPRRWGAYRVGALRVRARDRLGFFSYEQLLDSGLQLRVYPRAEEVRRLVPARETQTFAGNEVSRGHGEGLEFASIRPFVAGDRVRRINWRLSTRSGELHVNELHPERNRDVVIFLDSFSELRGPAGEVLEPAVRAAATLADRYLAERDRVGLVSFGGILRWLVPELGPLQAYRIVEALVDTAVMTSYAWKGVDVIPVRTLPPGAMVLAISPLLDERSIATLFDLRSRGFDVAIVELSAAPYVVPEPTPVGALGLRIWKLERQALRERFQGLGVPVATWEQGRPLAAALEELGEWTRLVASVRR